jgi:hypothetical protein
MNELSKLIVLISLLYLIFLAARFPQTALNNRSKHSVLGIVIISGLATVSLFAVGAYLKFVFR